ncbi:TIR domain-containing protein [Arthrobacter sp. MI7-26]|uniref:TIR domain-containing protein n=1 Tax=Arthrobacter sp. MI7-26 TaxID=2993653 RepID=UPI0022492F37|nr:TIR domain-containing protein [Arthrobacter sp. MI7-26]MCX2749932.1 TIR domain-containing protein [Arthrobacter sp. MI7-26]
MKVFISWSGEKARDFALGLKAWLPFVIHDLDPWVSDVDIDSGAMSMPSIHNQLQTIRYGIICTTAENQNKPWINYEAGALWKSLDDSTNVVPLLLDLDRSAINSPLKNFQSRVMNNPATRKSEAQKLIASINAARSQPVNDDVLAESFETQWPKLEQLVERIASNPYAYTQVMTPEQRKLEDVHQEILKLAETQKSHWEVTNDSLDQVLERKETLEFGSFSAETSRQVRFEKVINDSLIARGSWDRAHVHRVEHNIYAVYTESKLPDEIKNVVEQSGMAIMDDILFDYRVTMNDDPGPDDL